MSERVVFAEEAGQQRHIRLIASGSIDEPLLDALTNYVRRQKRRLDAAALLADDDTLEWAE